MSKGASVVKRRRRTLGQNDCIEVETEVRPRWGKPFVGEKLYSYRVRVTGCAVAQSRLTARARLREELARAADAIATEFGWP